MAKPVHKDSNDCSSSSLDLFLLPPTQSSFQKGKSIDYHPITSLTDGGPIEFKVSGSGKEFLDLARSYLYLKLKLRYPRQTVLIWMVQVRLVLQTIPLQACSIKWTLFWVVN